MESLLRYFPPSASDFERSQERLPEIERTMDAVGGVASRQGLGFLAFAGVGTNVTE
jgi:hypothetical protein